MCISSRKSSWGGPSGGLMKQTFIVEPSEPLGWGEEDGKKRASRRMSCVGPSRHWPLISYFNKVAPRCPWCLPVAWGSGKSQTGGGHNIIPNAHPSSSLLPMQCCIIYIQEHAGAGSPYPYPSLTMQTFCFIFMVQISDGRGISIAMEKKCSGWETFGLLPHWHI